MSSILYLQPYQHNIINSPSPYTVVGHSAGSGTTYALILAAHVWCEKNPNKFVTFFTTARPSCSGGLGEKASELLKPFGYKYSKKSTTLTNMNGAKIKFVGCSGTELEDTLGLDSAFIIFDVGCPTEFIAKHLPRASKCIVAGFLQDMVASGSWARRLGLLRDDCESFIPLVHYIPAAGAVHNETLVKENPAYLRFLATMSPEHKRRLTHTDLETF